MLVKLPVKFHLIWSPVGCVLIAVKKLQNKDKNSGAGIFTKSLETDIFVQVSSCVTFCVKLLCIIFFLVLVVLLHSFCHISYLAYLGGCRCFACSSQSAMMQFMADCVVLSFWWLWVLSWCCGVLLCSTPSMMVCFMSWQPGNTRFVPFECVVMILTRRASYLVSLIPVDP